MLLIYVIIQLYKAITRLHRYIIKHYNMYHIPGSSSVEVVLLVAGRSSSLSFILINIHMCNTLESIHNTYIGELLIVKNTVFIYYIQFKSVCFK